MDLPITVNVPCRNLTGRQHHFLNLGAGVQSTTLALMFERGEIVDMDGTPIRLNAAIFADTKEEPGGVYKHLDWLMGVVKSYPILVRSRSKLGDDLMRGENSSGQRFASIPAYTKAPGDKREGQIRRQCSKEYKVDVIEKTIRREALGLKLGRQVPKGVTLVQYIGFSLDEAGRARRLMGRHIKTKAKFRSWLYRFPLIEGQITRTNCKTYLSGIVPHQTPRSACVFCLYHDDLEWYLLKTTDPESWERAVEVDEALREPGRIVNRGVDKPLYLHRSCTPLVQVELNPANLPKYETRSMAGECDGVCGV